MDKQYLFENKLYDAHRHFRHLSEWNREGARRIDEAGPGMPPPPEDDNQDQGMGGDPGAGAPGGDMGGDPGMGATDQGIGGDPGAGAPGGDMGGDPGMGAPDGGMDGDLGGEAPEGDMGGDPGMGAPDGGMDSDLALPDDMEGGEDEEEDDVIDVDDLTKAQQKTNDQVNKVGRNLDNVDDKIVKMADMINSLERMIDSQNKDIMDLRKELIKRNPTQTEKLNLRSLDSYPFNVQPTDYWDNINKSDGNYEAYSDNEEPTTQEYEITNDDVDNYNEADIANSFDIGDDMDQTIKKIFGI